MRHAAIRNIHPNVVNIMGDEWDELQASEGNGNAVVIDQAAVNAEEVKLQAAYDAQGYARNRATAYASIGDQLDMQYHDGEDGTTTWKDHVASVKAAHPK